MKQINILGAIIGDTIGSIYEFNPTNDYNFKLTDRMIFTDDSIITIAVADWILHSKSLTHKDLAERMRYWGNKYNCPLGGYGGMFSAWLKREGMGPYNSWGNGSAMRVSPIGFACTTLEDTLKIAKISAEITHNHLEGIKGAQATAAAIFLARTGKTKEDIRRYISNTFNYNLNQSCEEIRKSYHFNESCQGTVPQSLIAFFDSNNFEDAIRLTISLGGDADTMGAITGAVAAAYYKEAPESLVEFVFNKLPEEFVNIIEEFDERFSRTHNS